MNPPPMKKLLTLLVLLVPIGSHAQDEWFLRMKPLRTSEMGWAQRGGVAFSLGDYIIFGMGYNSNLEPSASFKKYDPATNTFASFSGSSYTLDGPYAGEGAVGFSIGDIGYAGLGGSYGWSATNMIYRYTLAPNNFWDLDPLEFPGGSRVGAVCFVINGKAYIGGGENEGGWQNYNDLWQYAPATGWAQRTNMPAAIDGGTAFVLNGKGYVISSTGTALWSYDPIIDVWSTKAPYPGGVRDGAVALVKDGKAFVGTGNYTQSFFAYDPATDTWSTAPALWAPIGRSHAVSASHGDRAYLIGGEDGGMNRAAEIWELGPTAPLVPGTWAQRPYLPAAVRERPIAFTINDILYVGGGITGSGIRLTDLWAYEPIARTWTARAAMPAAASAGVEAAASAEGKGYVLIGRDSANFWAYDPVSDAWTQSADLPGGKRTYTVAFGLGARIFITTGLVNTVRRNDLWAYDPETDTWEQRAATGIPVHSAAAFVAAGKGCICGGNIAGSSTATDSVRCYDPATNSWAAAAHLLGPNNMMSLMAFGIDDHGYRAGGTLSGTMMNAFHSYDSGTDAWSVEATSGGGWRVQGAGGAAAGRGFLSCGQVNQIDGFVSSSVRTNDLWEYIPFADPTTGVKAQANKPGLWLSPNPTTGSLEVRVTDNMANDALLQVVSVDGRVVLEHRMAGPRSLLDVSSLARGLYILNLQNANGATITQRFVRD